jgi:predicted Zn-dependent protease
MSQALLAQYGGEAVGAGLSLTDSKYQSAVSMALPVIAQYGVLMPYGRKQESSADRIGLTYMARAGYDPHEALNFWKRFAAYNQSHGGGPTLSFLSTHPLDETRIKDIEQAIPQVEAEMKSSVISAPAKK